MRNRLFFFCLILSFFSEGYGTPRKPNHNPVTVTTLSSKDISTYEEKAIIAINQVRKKHKLHPLKKWKALSDCARGHSLNMAKGKCPFGHEGFEKRNQKMNAIASVISFGENVAYCQHYKDPVQVTVKGWMNSPGHRENILGDFEETGMGVSIRKDGKIYFTQLFAKRMRKN
jgi:uncharacterized protein YkwD